MYPLDVANKTVLVVGGSSGIGHGIARAFHDRGAEAHVLGTRTYAKLRPRAPSPSTRGGSGV